jgi:hypothetical protein
VSTGGPSDPVRRTRIRWGTGGGAIGLVVGVIGGLLVGGNLTVLGVGTVGAVAAVAGVVLTATGQVMAHSDRRSTRGKDERDRLERAESRARARAEARQQVRDDAATVVVLAAFGGGGRTDNVFVQCNQVRFQLTNGSRLPISGINLAIEPPVEFPHLAGDRPLSLVAGGSATWWQTTKPFAIPADQAGDRPLLTRAAVVTFTLDGRTWRTQSGIPPELVLGALPDLD